MVRRSALFVVLVGVAFGAGVTLGLARSGMALPSISAPSLPQLAGPGDTAAPASSPRVAAVSESDAAAIRGVIQRANEEQVRAIAGGDPTVMRDTATARHYDELVKVNEDLVAAGVTKIALVSLEWGDVTVTGDSARAVTYETWQATYDDGSVDRSRDENDYTLVRQNGQWLIAADDQPGNDTTGSTGPSADRPPVGAVSPGTETSSNWSGYVATGGTFTSVTATWVVPQPSRTTGGVDATWVGIGGVSGRDLIQAGTQTIASSSTVRYQAWIETLPQSAQVVPLTVAPGDRVRATVTSEGGRSWRITLRNDTSGDDYTTTVSYASSFSSAEWIEEAPSGGRQVLPLNDFGTIPFSGATAVRDGRTVTIAQADGRPLTMINALRQPLAQPSALGADGASFTVTRTSAPADVNPYRGRSGR